MLAESSSSSPPPHPLPLVTQVSDDLPHAAHPNRSSHAVRERGREARERERGHTQHATQHTTQHTTQAHLHSNNKKRVQVLSLLALLVHKDKY
jgi:hypothetical protein